MTSSESLLCGDFGLANFWVTTVCYGVPRLLLPLRLRDQLGILNDSIDMDACLEVSCAYFRRCGFASLSKCSRLNPKIYMHPSICLGRPDLY